MFVKIQNHGVADLSKLAQVITEALKLMSDPDLENDEWHHAMKDHFCIMKEMCSSNNLRIEGGHLFEWNGPSRIWTNNEEGRVISIFSPMAPTRNFHMVFNTSTQESYKLHGKDAEERAFAIALSFIDPPK